MNLLPKEQIESLFKISLTCHEMPQNNELRVVRPRVYEDVFTFLLSVRNRQDLKTTPGSTPHSNIVILTNHVCWQQLRLFNGEVFSEIILVTDDTHAYLAYLSLLPDTYGLFAPAFMPDSLALFDNLLHATLRHVLEWATVQNAQDITTTLYNPNLLKGLTDFGFKQSKHGPDIVGLPLPANYVLHLKSSGVMRTNNLRDW